MSKKFLFSISFIIWLLACWFLFQLLRQDGDASKPAYDESANALKQVGDAMSMPTREHKRILLQFGANWCVWCHKLHELFDNDQAIAKELKTDYLVVLVDVNNGHNQDVVEKFGEPTQLGLPVMVVLDANGKLLVTQSTGELVDPARGLHDPAKVLSFLRKWAPAERTE